MTSFIALANSAGIACSSDTDHTIFQLSKIEPLAIAVNPSSPIPWDDIVDLIKSNGSFASKEDFDQLSPIIDALTTIMANKWNVPAAMNSRIVSRIQDYLVYMHDTFGPESWDIIKLINNYEPLDEIFKLLGGEKYTINIYDYDSDEPGEVWKIRVGRR